MSAQKSAPSLSFGDRLCPGKLPNDYLPAAFDVPAESADKFQLLPSPDKKEGSRRPVGQIKAGNLGDPFEVASAMSQLDCGAFGLGPGIAEIKNRSEDEDPARLNKAKKSAKVVGVVDAGIAFWNQRFVDSKSGCNRFEDVGFLEFDRCVNGRPGARFLKQCLGSTVKDFTGKFATQRDLIDDLGEKFPSSIYGRNSVAGRLYSEGGLNHGTATADLALGVCPAPAVAFGLELPAAALTDATGGVMKVALPFAIQAMLRRIVSWANDKCVTPQIDIAIPVAFSGAPLAEGSGLVQEIQDVVSACGLEDVRFHIPLGNHRQAQMFARIDGKSTSPLHWFLAPDDHASNTIEIHCSAEHPHLQITSPEGDEVDAELNADGFQFLYKNDQKIGALWVYSDEGNRRMARLTLAGTSPKSRNGQWVPAGDWQINVTGVCEETPALLWILRKDILVGDQFVPPYRQSVFRNIDYQRADNNGRPHLEDPQPITPIKRRGTAAPLAYIWNKNVVPAQAMQAAQPAFTGTELPTNYGGAYESAENDQRAKTQVLSEAGLHGRMALGNGGPRQFRVAGTSFAAALNTGK